MVQLLGLHSHEETLVSGLIAQFAADDFVMGELNRVEKCVLPGYNGMVVPVHCGRSDRFHMTMQLASVNPFTVAHELAHVSDISTRRKETLDHLSLEMPTGWHLAHRMSSEYYANRVACAYADESDVFLAFQNDCAGMRGGARQGDWASTLIHYALLLGIMHGMDRQDCDPAALLGQAELPDQVRAGFASFRHQAPTFFDGYGDGECLAQAA
ncbi:MAG: hypothetical protein NVV74_19090 [Magnetospirillum sp.]|nr:hypothetical protein [Magnetospirillum sp.]